MKHFTITISVNGDLHDVCQHIEERFHLNAINLVNYANAAPHVETVGDSIWPIGSIFPNEYRLLYALIRAIRPDFAIEAGTYWGCSATAILSGLDKNEHGKLLSMDKMEDMGGRIPHALRYRWQGMRGEASQLMTMSHFAQACDFFFEDTDHTRESTRAILSAALPHMKRGAFMACHDPVSRPAVLEGLADLGIHPEVYLLEGSNCGVALWQNL